MYAKLVVGASSIPAVQAMRDIARLCTSSSPTTALLGGFSTTSSTIIDNTPAGWTYVGSTNATDRPTICNPGTTGYTASGTQCNLVMSAPCIEGSALKYAVLSTAWIGVQSSSSYLFALTGAVSATSLGVCTNEGPRYWSPAANGVNDTAPTMARANAGDIIHVVATQRGITIINEGRGMLAVWEMSMSDVNRFYGTAPFVQLSHATSSVFTGETIIVPTQTTVVMSRSILSAVFGVTDVNTGTYYGTYDPGAMASGSPNQPTLNIGGFYQTNATMRQNSINASGAARYQVTPVFVQAGALGHPTQSISGTTPVYWTKGAIGATGDTLTIGGDAYTFFNCGTGYGLALKTS